MQLKYPAYLFITNLYVSFGFFFYMYRDKRARQKFFFMFCKGSKVGPEKQLVVRNLHGKPLILEDTPEIHFKNLEKAWE
uniref:Uncharacterized protein n=1 Tax=Acrobeloides nanus TaxID=290746 RepID=A0A914DJB6_9BILA